MASQGYAAGCQPASQPALWAIYPKCQIWRVHRRGRLGPVARLESKRVKVMAAPSLVGVSGALQSPDKGCYGDVVTVI